MALAAVVESQMATCSEWKERVKTGRGLAQSLASLYTSSQSVQQERQAHLLTALCRFETSFPESSSSPVYLFRAPARVNLRGMHIDKHGGACNAVAIDREVVAVVLPTAGSLIEVRSISAPYVMSCGESAEEKDEEVSCESVDVREAETESESGERRGGGWRKYLLGCLIALARHVSMPVSSLAGCKIVLRSDIPQGSGLSSSHAFIISLLGALEVANKFSLSAIEEIQLAKEAERLSGTATGLSDQGAILLARCGSVLHANFYEADIDGISKTISYAPFPTQCQLIVADSMCTRSLSGAAAVGYALPRFAYSMALCLLQKTAKKLYGQEVAGRLDRLERVAGETMGGEEEVLRLFLHLPQRSSIEELLSDHPEYAERIREAKATYLDLLEVDVGDLPLRGPALFGVAECERARAFYRSLTALQATAEEEEEKKKELVEYLGALMSAGHMGDHHAGSLDVGDSEISSWMADVGAKKTSLALIPGSFNASIQQLDTMQAALLSCGAVGASLTGGGMGGCVVALLPSDTRDGLERAREVLRREYYGEEMSGRELRRRVFTAVPVRGACFL